MSHLSRRQKESDLSQLIREAILCYVPINNLKNRVPFPVIFLTKLYLVVFTAKSIGNNIYKRSLNIILKFSQA